VLAEQSQPVLHSPVRFFIKQEWLCGSRALLGGGDAWFASPQVEPGLLKGRFAFSHRASDAVELKKQHDATNTNKSVLCPAFLFLIFWNLST